MKQSFYHYILSAIEDLTDVWDSAGTEAIECLECPPVQDFATTLLDDSLGFGYIEEGER